MGAIQRIILTIGLGVISSLLYDLIKTDNMELFQNLDIPRAIMVFIIIDLVFVGINIILKSLNKPKIHHFFEWFDTEKKHLKTENKYLKLKIKELERQKKRQ